MNPRATSSSTSVDVPPPTSINVPSGASPAASIRASDAAGERWYQLAASGSTRP